MLAVAAASAPAAHAANTWAGVWNSDFGRLTMDAGGAGSYEGFSPGTVSGGVDGNVNKGTWQQPGTPPKGGTYTFTLSGDGRSFTGTWAYDAGGCGTACGWNGTCIEGACLKNGVTATPPPPPPPPPPAPQPSGVTCQPAGLRAFAAANCVAGKLPYGLDVFMPVPKSGAAANISPAPIPIDTKQLGIDLADAFAEVQAEQLAAAIAVKLNKDPHLKDAFTGCIMFAMDVEDELVITKDGVYTRYGTEFAGPAALAACEKILLGTRTTAPRAHAAAASCRVLFVPSFRKGRKVTKRMRTRAVAAAKSQLSATCTKRAGGGVTATVRARRTGSTLNKVVRGRVLAAARRRLPAGAQDAAGARLKLRWTAKRR